MAEKITALYLRVSSVIKEDTVSLADQRKYLRRDYDGENVVEYVDEGFSGKTLERPALQQILQDCKDGKIEKVVTYRMDRFSRMISDFSKIMDVFIENGVEFVSLCEQFDSKTPLGKSMLYNTVVNQQLQIELKKAQKH